MKVTKDNFSELIDYIVKDKFSYLEEITVESVKGSIEYWKSQLPLEVLKNQKGMESFCAAHKFTFSDAEYNQLIIKTLKNMYPKGVINIDTDYEFPDYIFNLANNWELKINYIEE